MAGASFRQLKVVIMPDGQVATFDNRRIQAARNAGIDALVNVHRYDDLVPPDFGDRGLENPDPNGSNIPDTWGQAIEWRVNRQDGKWFRKRFKHGTPHLWPRRSDYEND